MLYVAFSNVMVILGFQSPFILIQWGWLVSWAYLRFYKKVSMGEGTNTLNGPADVYGDRSETFAFVQWFPPPVQYAQMSSKLWLTGLMIDVAGPLASFAMVSTQSWSS